jgi:hypothetical protein
MADNNEKWDAADHGNYNYDPDMAHPVHNFDEDHPVEYPPHTTEWKLMRKVDLRVIPVLSIMYLMVSLESCCLII